MTALSCDIRFVDMVRDFHVAMGHPVCWSPVEKPDPERMKARYHYILEEFHELKDAIKECDYVEIADALCDIQYLLIGCALELGLSFFDESCLHGPSKSDLHSAIQGLSSHLVDRFDLTCVVSDLQHLQGCIYHLLDNNGWRSTFYDMFKAVHENNMSKRCLSEGEVKENIHWYQDVKQIEAYSRRIGDGFILYRQDNDKVLKPMNFKPVDLKPWVK